MTDSPKPFDPLGPYAKWLAQLAEGWDDKPRAARFDCGSAAWGWLKATFNRSPAFPEYRRADEPWTPPPTTGSMYGIPIAIHDGIGDRIIRAIGHDGQIISEWETPE